MAHARSVYGNKIQLFFKKTQGHVTEKVTLSHSPKIVDDEKRSISIDIHKHRNNIEDIVGFFGGMF